MQARELIELAAVVTAQAPALVESASILSKSALDQYWAATRCRHDRWQQSFTDFRVGADRHGSQRSQDSFLATAEEILASEVLTRVWTAILVAFDRRRDLHEAEPIA